MKPVKHGNKWRIPYRCPGYPKPINESFDSLEEAWLRIAEINLAKKRGTLRPPAHLADLEKRPEMARETMTVEQLMTEYLNVYGINHWSPSTLSCNQHRIRDYIIPYIGDVRIKDLTTHRLERFYQQLLTAPAVALKGRGQEERTISPSVVAKIHALLRSALNQAIRWGYLQSQNPALVAEPPKYTKQERDTWTEREAQEALQLCEDPILKICMMLALGCSMRIGEILGLTWDCVHMDPELIEHGEAYLEVKKELQRVDIDSVTKLENQGRADIISTFPCQISRSCSTVLALKVPKTESSVRTIYLPNAVIAVLQQTRCHQERMKEALDSCYEDFNLVVAQDNGRPYEERRIMDKLRTLIEEHSLKAVVFHSLRHTSTSLKLQISGGDIKTVQRDTGHSQSRMVTDVYSHSFDDDRKALARRMDREFFGDSHGTKPETPAPQPVENSAAAELMQLLNESPELTEKFLEMAQFFMNGPR